MSRLRGRPTAQRCDERVLAASVLSDDDVDVFERIDRASGSIACMRLPRSPRLPSGAGAIPRLAEPLQLRLRHLAPRLAALWIEEIHRRRANGRAADERPNAHVLLLFVFTVATGLTWIGPSRPPAAPQTPPCAGARSIPAIFRPGYRSGSPSPRGERGPGVRTPRLAHPAAPRASARPRPASPA